MDELKDSIIWCIKHKNDLGKYGTNGRKMFDNDTQYFNNILGKTIRDRL
jgi:hypothetical protein